MQMIHAWTGNFASTMSIPRDLVMVRLSTSVGAFYIAVFGVSAEGPEKCAIGWCWQICTRLFIFHFFPFNVIATIGDIVFYDATCEKRVTMYKAQKCTMLEKSQGSLFDLYLLVYPTVEYLKVKYLTGTWGRSRRLDKKDIDCRFTGVASRVVKCRWSGWVLKSKQSTHKISSPGLLAKL